MKKLYFACTILSLLLTSCYNTKITVGEIPPGTPLQEVATKWNNHFVFGLVPGNNASLNAKDYIGGYKQNYVMKTSHPFVHQLIGCLTFGIYTPTETKFYIPFDGLVKNNQVPETKIAYVKNGYIAYEFDDQEKYLSDSTTDADYSLRTNNEFQKSISKKAADALNIKRLHNFNAKYFGHVEIIVGKYGNVIHAQLVLKESVTNPLVTGSLLQEIYHTVFPPLDEKYTETQKTRVTIPLATKSN